MNIQSQKRSIPDRRPAYLGNGLIGLPVAQIPFLSDHAFVTGYVGESAQLGVEAISPAPYPLGVDVGVDGHWFSDRPHMARFGEQSLDFASGELTSRFVVAAPAATVQVQVLTFCSRTQPMVVVQRSTFEVDKACKLVLRAQVDWGGTPGRLLERIMPGRSGAERAGMDRDAIVLWSAPGDLTRLGICYDSLLRSGDVKSRLRNDYGHERDLASTEYTLDAKPGAAYVLDQVAALVPSGMHEAPHWQANRMVANAMWRGADRLREENGAAWAELWKGRPVLIGADSRWQEITDACYFYVHSSIHPSTIQSIPPFGLSCTNYSGHVFWDYETFMFPAVLLTAPEAARASLDYRTRCVPMARHNARMHGQRGIQFPWQSGLTGSEVTNYYCNAREFHINPAVAFAFGEFAHATGDELFIQEQAWPILKGVAEWAESFLIKTERGYESHHLASPNEQFHDVNNDAQFHLFLKAALRDAIWCGEHLGKPVPERWRDIVEHLFFPVDPKTGSVVQFERFDPEEHGAGSIGPMYAMFPLAASYGAETDRATREFFRKGIWSYVGSPMSSAYCAVWLARMGEEASALEALEKGIASRVVDPFMQMTEAAPAPSREPWLTGRTCFVTGQGGLLTSLLLGFPGLGLRPGDPAESWPDAAPALPGAWEAIEVERIQVKGRPARLVARQGRKRTEIIF